MTGYEEQSLAGTAVADAPGPADSVLARIRLTDVTGALRRVAPSARNSRQSASIRASCASAALPMCR